MALQTGSETVVWLCHVARGMNVLLDHDETLDVLRTRRHILDGDLFTRLDQRFSAYGLALSYIPTVYQAALCERFQDLAVARVESKYCVADNGLCVVLAYCIESIQQLATASG